MKIINKFYFPLLFVYFLILFFFFPSSTLAQPLFLDEFNGNGELHSYNSSYELLSDFHSNTGPFILNGDHVEATNNDPGYLYTAIPGENICASIDFNWTGGYPDGHWTLIALHSLPNSFGTAFEVRDDFGTQQRWQYYNKTASTYLTGIISFDENQTHTLKACRIGTTVTGYLDNNLLFTHQETSYSGGYMGFGAQEHTYYLDNFKIEKPTNLSLNVPILKQTASPWQSEIYDKANLWNSSDPSINAWGCALTSATMVLNFHGINLLPDGTLLDPGTLNTWLNQQIDGYLGNGLVNWLAISRLSKLAKNINGVTKFDALEYSRTDGIDNIQLQNDITANIPDILEEPGHFVVVKGKTPTSFAINDPFFNRLDLTSYGNSYLSIGRFVPSLTNLSYIMIVLDTTVQGILKDTSNTIVGQSFTQNPITHPQNANQNNGLAKRIIYVQKPTGERYNLFLSNSQASTYSAKVYLYDKNGNVVNKTEEGVLDSTKTDIITIKFNENQNSVTYIERRSSFQSIIDDIIALRKLRSIKKEKLKTDLIALMQKAEKIVTARVFKKKELKQKFDDFSQDLKQNRDKDMTENAYQILLYDLQYLKDLYLK